jgi:hypothetical protein
MPFEYVWGGAGYTYIKNYYMAQNKYTKTSDFKQFFFYENREGKKK